MNKTLLYLGIPIVLLAIFFWGYFPTLTRYRELKSEEDAIALKIKNLDSKIALLEEEQDLLLNNSQYLEKVIRDELGLVKPGEVVYKFVERQQPKEPSADSVVAEEVLELQSE